MHDEWNIARVGTSLLRPNPIWIALAACLLLAASGCRNMFGDGADTADSPTFEIVNFSQTRDEKKYEYLKQTTWTYTGKGTLLVREEKFRKQTYVVFLQQKRTPSPDGSTEWTTPWGAVLVNGVADVSSHAQFDSTRFDKDPGQPKIEWRLAGYLPVRDAKLITPE